MESLDKRYKMKKSKGFFFFSFSIMLLSLMSSVTIFLYESFGISIDLFLAIFDTSVVVFFIFSLFFERYKITPNKPLYIERNIYYSRGRKNEYKKEFRKG